MSPFKIVYDRDPSSILDYIPATTTTEVVDKMLICRQDLLQQLKGNLFKAQKAMKKIANGHRRDLQLNVGDLVLVKLQPYRQISRANQASNKLSARYFSPFKVIKQIGQVAYQLELPSIARIHGVFNVSLLKPYNGQQPAESMALPNQIINIHPILEPHMVLQERKTIRHNEVVP